MIRKIDSRQNRQLHSLLSQLGLSDPDQKAELVEGASNGRVSSSADLHYAEAEALLKKLKATREQLVGKTRGKIIHLLCLLGMVKEDGTPNYERINAWVQNCGKNNPKRYKLYRLSPAQMNAVCTQVEAWYKRGLEKAEA